MLLCVVSVCGECCCVWSVLLCVVSVCGQCLLLCVVSAAVCGQCVRSVLVAVCGQCCGQSHCVCGVTGVLGKLQSALHLNASTDTLLSVVLFLYVVFTRWHLASHK